MFIVPALIGVVLLVMKQNYYKAAQAAMDEYSSIESMKSKLNNLKSEYDLKKADLQAHYEELAKNSKDEYESFRISTLKSQDDEIKGKEKELSNLKLSIASLRDEIKALETGLVIKHFDFSEYDALTSEECKNKLALIKADESSLVKDGKAVAISSNGSKKEINDNIKQIIRCFNTEVDNALINLTVKNIDSSRSKVSKSFESLNRIFAVDGIELSKELLEFKLEELNLIYSYELKKEEEAAQQKAIREQMVEEEKVRREIEKEQKKIEKDQQQCSNEITKLMQYIQKTESDVEKQLYIDKIKELESKLNDLEEDKKAVDERAANALAGFVYIISNIGSFGDDVYKIGMTRRLEPMDRIKELSSASVPFEFDVHAMIFSDNAPELETMLHNHFKSKSVNRINYRKEFFRVSIDEIEKTVKENFNNTVQFTKVPVAAEYRQTLNLLESESK
ncbi:MAG: DUF4041 domain-containing protein [Anaerovoracaceae bacterium]